MFVISMWCCFKLVEMNCHQSRQQVSVQNIHLIFAACNENEMSATFSWWLTVLSPGDTVCGKKTSLSSRVGAEKVISSFEVAAGKAGGRDMVVVVAVVVTFPSHVALVVLKKKVPLESTNVVRLRTTHLSLLDAFSLMFAFFFCIYVKSFSLSLPHTHTEAMPSTCPSAVTLHLLF